MLMSRYPDERKATLLAKLLPPHNMTVAEFCPRGHLSAYPLQLA